MIVYQVVQIARTRAALHCPGAEPVDPDRISFTLTLRALVRTIGENAPPARLLRTAIREIREQPLLRRRLRAKPREPKGTVALARVTERRPPGAYAVSIKPRKPITTPP